MQHKDDQNNEGLYDLVVYGNMMKGVAAMEVIHFLLRRKLEPAWDWVFIALNVTGIVSAAGVRVRMTTTGEQGFKAYDKEIFRAFLLGALIHVPVKVFRLLMWREDERRVKETAQRQREAARRAALAETE